MAAALVLTVGFAGCDTNTALMEPPPPSFAISDGAHGNGGNANFFFLPPMVSKSQTNGAFDASLDPVIRITAEDGFDITLSADLDNSNSHYHQNWHTDDYSLVDDQIYRICVLVDDQVLGFADVQVVANGSGLKNVADENIALKDGRTLPIMFRIEEGDLGGGGGDCSAGGGNGGGF